MTIIKLLKPFEEALESRRFKLILYLLTSVILAPVAAYLAHIGLRPVHIIWCIWLLIMPVAQGIYFVWSSIENSRRQTSKLHQVSAPEKGQHLVMKSKDSKQQRRVEPSTLKKENPGG